MRKGHSRPRWWILYVVCGLILGLFWREATVPLNQTEHTLVEIGLVLLLYGWVAVWLKANEGALLLEEEEQRKCTYQTISSSLPFSADQASEEVVSENERDRGRKASGGKMMFTQLLTQLRSAAMLLVLLSILTGLVYPVLVTGIAQVVFPRQANGSLMEQDGQPIGSELIGQAFADPRYFWSRPSATSPFPYNAAASSGSNLGPTNPALEDAVRARMEALRVADPGNTSPIPVDLVTASGSGLDPHISVAAALYQVPRVARERGLSEELVRALVAQYTEGRQLGFLGEPRVNVLKLNLALDMLK